MRSLLPFASVITAFALVTEAGAAIVYFPNEDIPIPSNFAGVSIDLETGLSSTALGGITNGDANFFFGGAELSNDADQAVAVPSWQPVRAGSGNTDIVLNLPEGEVVDATGAVGMAGSTYSTGFGSSGDITTHFPEFTPGTRGFIGFSMVPNAGGAPLYGWVEVTLEDDGVTPGVVHAWAYESIPGASIVVGIPEPGTASLAILGLAGALMRRRR